MPPTTSFRFGDIVLVPFPFTDQTAVKKRPAIAVSSAGFQARRRVIKKLGSLERADRESLQDSLQAILG